MHSDALVMFSRIRFDHISVFALRFGGFETTLMLKKHSSSTDVSPGQVLNKDWLDLTHTFQAVRFTPKPMMKNMDYGLAEKPRSQGKHSWLCKALRKTSFFPVCWPFSLEERQASTIHALLYVFSLVNLSPRFTCVSLSLNFYGFWTSKKQSEPNTRIQLKNAPNNLNQGLVFGLSVSPHRAELRYEECSNEDFAEVFAEELEMLN